MWNKHKKQKSKKNNSKKKKKNSKKNKKKKNKLRRRKILHNQTIMILYMLLLWILREDKNFGVKWQSIFIGTPFQKLSLECMNLHLNLKMREEIKDNFQDLDGSKMVC